MTNQLLEDRPLPPIKPEVRNWMRSIGFVHESEIEEASCTTSRFRKAWPLRPIQFGLENWYALEEIKQYLTVRSSESSIDREVTL